ncbi:hypothetical protein F4804DRAFT_323964 [Jackrogersella minutella]|nr:hypothetical protein F4804DRAFT_323964 [Jackrogersella minutella]
MSRWVIHCLLLLTNWSGDRDSLPFGRNWRALRAPTESLRTPDDTCNIHLVKPSTKCIRYLCACDINVGQRIGYTD